MIFQALSWFAIDKHEEEYQEESTSLLRKSKITEERETVDHHIYIFGRTKNQSEFSSLYRDDDEIMVRDYQGPNIPDKIIQFQNPCDKDNVSICLHVTGFRPYFYILLPDHFDNFMVGKLVKVLTDRLEGSIKWQSQNRNTLLRNASIEHQYIKKKKLFPYTAGKEFKFAKLIFNNKLDYESVKKNITYNEIKLQGCMFKFELYESKIDSLIKFIHVRNLKSTGYIKVNNYEKDYDTSFADITVKCNYKEVFKSTDEELAHMLGLSDVYREELDRYTNPLVVVSIDIEVQLEDAESGEFPNYDKLGDIISVIGVTKWTYPTNLKYEKYALVVGECSPIPDVTIIRCRNESDLLINYCNIINKLDPDAIIGYNIWRFDENYISQRISLLGLDIHRNKLSRLPSPDTKIVKRSPSSSAMGDNEFLMFDYIGRDSYDIMFAILREHKLNSYKLDDVSEHFLDKHKDDVSVREIFALLAGTPDDVARVVKYCIQDTCLPLELLNHLCIIPNSMEMAGTTYVPNNWLLYMGQQIKGYTLICKYARENNFLVPDIISYIDFIFRGATVLDPEPAAHEVPVAGLDFASLYPSIMMAHNLCYSTIVLDSEYLNLPGVCYETFDWYDDHPDDDKLPKNKRRQIHSHYVFVQDPENSYEEPKNPKNMFERGPKITQGLDSKKCYAGILPKILSDLKMGRTETKKKMKKLIELNPENKKSSAYKVLDAKQLAQKVTMNSMYGLCGTGTNGMLPLKPISATVTARGRFMIEHTKKTAETLYNCRALYGDSIRGSEYVYVNYKDNSCNTKIQVSDFGKYSGLPWTKYDPSKDDSKRSLLMAFKSTDDIQKEEINLTKMKKYSTLTASGPSPILRVIRHKTPKKLYKVSVKDTDGNIRSVVVTEDHSLVTADGHLVVPGEMKNGLKLMSV